MKLTKQLTLAIGIVLSVAVAPSFINSDVEFAEDIAAGDASFTALLQKNVSSSGKVNYAGFKSSIKELDGYLKYLSENKPSNSSSKNKLKAYWMNVYNAYTIKLILNNYPLKSIKDIGKPWNVKFIKIGDKTYDLNSVENSILRKMGDARIHVGINCASISCPKLHNKAFTEANVEAELTKLTKAFLKDKTKNQISEGEVKLSEIFNWFKVDFSSGKVIDWINKYSDTKVKSTAKISYLAYNWNLNK
jgi:hypothetical protein